MKKFEPEQKLLCRMWSRAQTCYPKDNIKCEHRFHKLQKQKNFIRLNKEAIVDYQSNKKKSVLKLSEEDKRLKRLPRSKIYLSSR